jgi:triosephosphate isomerase
LCAAIERSDILCKASARERGSVTRRCLIAGNWKMNKTPEETEAFLEAFLPRFLDAPGVEVLLIPPYTSLESAGRRLSGTPIELGAQDVYHEASGAYTGAISAAMIAGCGCRYVLVGHSERRHVFGDDDDVVRRKLEAALGGGLSPILCVGEALDERRAGETGAVLTRQLSAALERIEADAMDRGVIAYEPVWAIGTGETATPAQAQEAIAGIRGWLTGRFDGPTAGRVRILYGGSVKPGNAAALVGLPDVDGALVGGASLDPEAFAAIVEAGRSGASAR